MKASLPSRLSFRILATLQVLLFLACSQSNQQDDDKEQAHLTLALLSVLFLDSGNCARSYKTATNSGQLYCSRAPRSLCNSDQGFFTRAAAVAVFPLVYGRILVTTDTQNRYRTEWGYYSSDVPTCATAAAAATQLSTYPQPGFRLSTTTQVTEATTIFSHQVIDDCAATGNSNLGKLANKDQMNFLLSPRGVLAWQARLTGQTSCFSGLKMSDSERQAAIDYTNGTLILETVCNYGSAAAPNNCTSAEKGMASPFDFSGAL
ncbi:MAG: hypothetical protein JNM27_18055 [Leptospirales bacterium]|nr:hypothetical protein [Leptospirales bacterium]